MATKYSFNPFLSNLDKTLKLDNPLDYQGTWDADTNTPTLASGTGTTGDFYLVSVAGTTNLDGITDWQIGDELFFNGTAWERVGKDVLRAAGNNTEIQINTNGLLDSHNSLTYDKSTELLRAGKLILSPTTGDTQLTIKNNGDSTGARYCSSIFEFSDGDGAAIKAIRPSVGAYTDTHMNFFAGGNLSNAKFIIEADGTLNVGHTANYENLVTDDDDIPNKKYVDDAISVEDFWDRTGTTLSTRNVGDSVLISGALWDNAITLRTPVINGYQEITYEDYLEVAKAGTYFSPQQGTYGFYDYTLDANLLDINFSDSGKVGVMANPDSIDSDFTIKKLTTGDAYVFDAGAETTKIDSANGITLTATEILMEGDFGINETANNSVLTSVSDTNTKYAGLFYESGVTPVSTSTLTNLLDKTVSIQGLGSAYFHALDTTNSIEAIYGISSTGLGFIGTTTNHDFDIRTNSVSRILIDNAGDVTVQNKLIINDDGQSATFGTSNFVDKYITFRPGSTAGLNVGLDTSLVTGGSFIFQGGVSKGFGFVTNKDTNSFGCTDSELTMYFTSDQKVAVGGITSATATFEVKGDSLFNRDSEDKDFAVNSVSSSPALFVQGSDGNIGINNNSPTAKLHIIGDSNTEQLEVKGYSGQTDSIFRVATSGNSSVLRVFENKTSIFGGTVAIATAATANLLEILDSVTNPTDNHYPLKVTKSVNSSANITNKATQAAVFSLSLSPSAGTKIDYGDNHNVFACGINFSDAGDFGEVSAFKTQHLFYGSGTIDMLYGVLIGSSSDLSGGSQSVTNSAGVYIKSQNTNVTGTSYGIYQQGSSDINYFAGDVNMNQDLNVVGDLTVTGITYPQNGTMAMIVGADANATTITDSTQKYSRIGGQHYSTSEEPVGMLFSISSSVNTELKMGGGSSLFNAATKLQFYTANNNTTQTGTERMYIDSAGDVYMNQDLTLLNGDLYLPSDSTSIFLGVGNDMSLNYDGTDAIIDTGLVNPSDLIIDCGTDKTIELAETVWDDINLGAAQLSKPTSSQPDTDTFVDENGTDTGIQTYAFATGEKIHGGFELIHTYKEGTDLKPHVHFQIISAPSGTDYVRWKLTYTVLKSGQTLDTTQTIEGECPVDTQYQTYFCELPDITGTNYEIGDQFVFTLERITATGDAFAGDALIATVGVHHEVDTIGSRLVSTK